MTSTVCYVLMPALRITSARFCQVSLNTLIPTSLQTITDALWLILFSAFEFLDADSMRLSEKHLGSKNPVSASYPFYVLIEVQSATVHELSAYMTIDTRV